MATPQHPPTAPSLITVQIWNSTQDPGMYRNDWLEVTGALIEAVAADEDVHIRFASEGTDWSLVEGGVRTATGNVELDPFESKAFVVTATVPPAALDTLEERLEEFCTRREVPTMWLSSPRGLLVLGWRRSRR